jgi:hypothetical protein
MAKLHFGTALVVLAARFAFAQGIPSPPPFIHPNQEIRVHDLPVLNAQSKDAADVLATSLATIFHNKEICCGKNSTLGDRLPQSDPVSLREVAAQLQGRQLLPDGRPIMITAEYVAPDSLNSSQLVNAVLASHAPLMEWNSHLYVVSGVIFDESDFENGQTIAFMIRKILLLDPRFSDSRREVSFNRDTDDLGKVQGLLFVDAKPQ